MNKELLNIENNNNINRRYFYSINYPVFEEDLCKMEMKYLFDKIPSEKYLFSDYYVESIKKSFYKRYDFNNI